MQGGPLWKECIQTDQGVKQGDIPSPLFFNLVVDLVRQAEDTARGGQVRGGGNVWVVFYADDGRLGGRTQH